MGAFGAALLARGSQTSVSSTISEFPRLARLTAHLDPRSAGARPHAQDRALQGVLERTACSPSTTSASTRPRASIAASSRAIAARRAPARLARRRRPTRSPTCSSTSPSACSTTTRRWPSDDAPRGTVGIPRALNMYENYPFWFTFFTKLGLARGALRPVHEEDLRGGHRVHAVGERVLPGEALARPHHEPAGQAPRLHLVPLQQVGAPGRRRGAGNHFNCPIVASYAEALRLNIDELRDLGRRGS